MFQTYSNILRCATQTVSGAGIGVQARESGKPPPLGDAAVRCAHQRRSTAWIFPVQPTDRRRSQPVVSIDHFILRNNEVPIPVIPAMRSMEQSGDAARG